jgi:DNA-binding response OmpR family regulator
MFHEQRVLIAEGDERLRRKLYGMLLDRDIFSDCVSDSASAIEKLQREQYALVLLDLSLPPNGAEDVMQAVAAMARGGRPFILALATHHDARGLDVEVVQIVLRKPFDTGNTADIVQSCLSSVRRESHAKSGDGNQDGNGRKSARV